MSWLSRGERGAHENSYKGYKRIFKKGLISLLVIGQLALTSGKPLMTKFNEFSESDVRILFLLC